MLHPFMPFITEEIWQHIAPRKEGESIMVAQLAAPGKADEKLLARFSQVQEAVTAIRALRKKHNMPGRDQIELKVIADENFHPQFNPVLIKMANLSSVETVTEKDNAAAAFIVKTTQYFVPLQGSVDNSAELEKLDAELKYLDGFLKSVMAKLSNERFVASAPEKVVETERAKQTDAQAKIAAIRERIAALGK